MGSGVGRGRCDLAGVREGGRELPPRANAVLVLRAPVLLAVDLAALVTALARLFPG
jgi:hypothetical protein